MKIKMSKFKAAMFILAIMLTNIPIMADAVIIPISNNLYTVFGEHVGAVNFIVSGPQLIIAISSLLAAPIMMKVSKKMILVISGLLCVVGLGFGVVIENVWFVLICRVIAGIATGFINVAAVALIAEVYIDDNKRSYMMGLYNACMAAIGTAMSLVAGQLAVNGWTNAYKVFWSCIPMVICFALFLPNIKPEKIESENNEKESSSKTSFGFEFWLMMINLVIFYIANMGVSYFVSIYVSEHNLGNEAFAGTIASLSTIGSFFCCLAFGFLYNKLKRYIIFCSYILFALAVLLLILSPSKLTLIIAIFITGGSYGTAFSYSYAHAPSLVSESMTDTAISIATFVYAIGCFFATYVVTFLMGNGSFSSILPYILGFVIVAIVLEIISVLGCKVKKG